jgi:alpha-L-fucosidase
MKQVLKFLVTVQLLAVSSSVTALASDNGTFEEKLITVVPSERQYSWQRHHEVYAFVHFGPNTFTGREWGSGKENPAVFNPTALDAKQWAGAFKSAGMTMAVLTAKHHDGFCLWPSRYTGQSVKNSPLKDGKGDVVREFADALRAEGLAVGIYLSPADLFQIEDAAGYYGNGSQYVKTVIPTEPASIKSEPTKIRQTIAQGLGATGISYECTVDDYNRYFLNQLYELLTDYGPITEVWFDGATPKSRGGQRYSRANWYELIHKLQPNAVISVRGPDVRWAGNENGVARETEWSVIGLSKPAAESDWPDMTNPLLGDRATLAKAADLAWYPAEADGSILPGWFYHDDRNMKSPEKLMDMYENSVGHNSTLILNVPPDKRGLLTDKEVATLKAFGEQRQNRYGTNLAVGCSTIATSSLPDHPASAVIDGNYETYWEAVPKADANMPVTLEITLPHQVTFRRIILQEQIRRSQRVEAFTIEVTKDDGQWSKIGAATTIGYKRIIAVPETSTTHLRVRFDSYRVAPTIAEFGLFY